MPANSPHLRHSEDLPLRMFVRYGKCNRTVPILIGPTGVVGW